MCADFSRNAANGVDVIGETDLPKLVYARYRPPEKEIRHVEYVKEVADHPNYETALAAARGAAAAGA